MRVANSSPVFARVSLSRHLEVAPETENVGSERGKPASGERSPVARDNLRHGVSMDDSIRPDSEREKQLRGRW